MEKRRVFSLLLAAVLAVGILAGCGSNNPAPTSTKPSGSGSAPDMVGVSTDPESLTHEELVQRSDEIVIGAWQGAFALFDKGMPVTPDVQVLTDGETTDITCVNSYNETETWALQDVRDNIHALSEDGGTEG